MPIKGEGRNRGKWKIGVVERLIQGRDRMIRAKSWEDTHRDTTAAALSSWINLQQTWTKERRDAKSWRQRIPAEKSRIRWFGLIDCEIGVTSE